MKNIVLILIISLIFINSSPSNENLLNEIIQRNYNNIQNTYVSLTFGEHQTFSIYGDKVCFLIPRCESVQQDGMDIHYTNCLLTGVTDFNIKNGQNVVLTNTGILFDITIPYMLFTESNEVYHLEVSKKGTFFMNPERPFLKLGIFSFITTKFEEYKNSVLEQYTKILNDFYTPDVINKKDELNAILSLLFMRKPFYDVNQIDIGEKKGKVTYFNYLSNKFDTVVNMRDGARFGKLTIIVEYSVDFNLNYQEGNIIFDNFYFHDRSFSYDGEPTFENELFPEEVEEVKNFFKEKVPLDLNESQAAYYNGTNEY